MIDLCRIVSGLDLSPEAEEAMISYSDDLVDALIDAICLQTKERGAHRISEDDALKSVKHVSFFPARVVPRTTLKIFATRSRPDGEASTGHDAGATDNNQLTQRPSQPAIRSRKPIIDEARFLEDIRKMKPKDTRETQTYYSHKMVLEAKDLLPRLGAAAIAEAQAAVERPARHFVGRPQPLITEDRGCVQPELTTYNRYRNYLGIVGPMPNIKPNIGPLTKLPAYLQALQQRNEMLGLASGGSTVRQVPAQPCPVNRPTQQPIQPGPSQRPYQYPPQQQAIHIPQSIPMPMNVRQAVQRMPPNDAARLPQEFYQRQRRDGWVEELERSALMSPTPPLTECDYPLCAEGGHYHCALSRKSAGKTLSLTVEPTEKPPETPACTQELTPPDNSVWEPLEGPVDHVDCAEYYVRISSSATKARKAASEKAKSVEEQREKGKGQEEPVAESIRNGSRVLVLPKPPAHLSPEEVERFNNCVRRLQLIALGGSPERS